MTYIDIYCRTVADPSADQEKLSADVLNRIQTFWSVNIEPNLESIAGELAEERPGFTFPYPKSSELILSDGGIPTMIERDYQKVYEFKSENPLIAYTDTKGRGGDLLLYNERFIWDGKLNKKGIMHPLFEYPQMQELSRFYIDANSDGDGEELTEDIYIKAKFSKIIPKLDKQGDLYLAEDEDWLS